MSSPVSVGGYPRDFFVNRTQVSPSRNRHTEQPVAASTPYYVERVPSAQGIEETPRRNRALSREGPPGNVYYAAVDPRELNSAAGRTESSGNDDTSYNMLPSNLRNQRIMGRQYAPTQTNVSPVQAAYPQDRFYEFDRNSTELSEHTERIRPPTDEYILDRAASMLLKEGAKRSTPKVPSDRSEDGRRRCIPKSLLIKQMGNNNGPHYSCKPIVEGTTIRPYENETECEDDGENNDPLFILNLIRRNLASIAYLAKRMYSRLAANRIPIPSDVPVNIYSPAYKNYNHCVIPFAPTNEPEIMPVMQPNLNNELVGVPYPAMRVPNPMSAASNNLPMPELVNTPYQEFRPLRVTPIPPAENNLISNEGWVPRYREDTY